LSIGDLVADVVTRCPEIGDFPETGDEIERLTILKKYQFDDSSACLSASNDFMV
jgi:hypothetical protein